MNGKNDTNEIVFGPVPSRRLGRSLGINNIPEKNCSYSCIYCQVGKTDRLTSKRNEFYNPGKIFGEVSRKLQYLKKTREKIDYITFVSDGEPTLDINIGKSIGKLKSTGIKIAVITNSSMLWDKETRNDLMKADLVSVKIDTADPETWHRINRPHGRLNLEEIIAGIIEFSRLFSGKLVTETMLVKDINDSIKSVTETAKTIRKINPAVSYILVPTRPPAEKYVSAPPDGIINRAYQIYNTAAGKTELIIYSEGTEFTFMEDKERELLGILAVHPMQYDALHEYLRKSHSDIKFVNRLIKENILTKVKYGNKYFLMKKY